METPQQAPTEQKNNKKLSLAPLIRKICQGILPPEEPADEISLTDMIELKLMKLTATLSRCVYHKAEERNMPSKAGPLIFDSLNDSKSEVPYFVTNSDVLDTIFIACRGTYCFDNFLTDVNCSPKSAFDGYVHVGVYNSALIIYNQISKLVSDLSIKNHNRKLIITGHSLGAGVAAILGKMFLSDYPQIHTRCICWAPPAIFSKNLCAESTKYCKTFCNYGDPVPFLSVHNALSLDSIFSAETSTKIRKIKNKALNCSKIKIDLFGYKMRIKLPKSKQKISKSLYPPGVHYLLKPVNENEDEVVVLSPKTIKYFGHFINNLNEEKHSMKKYFAYIVSVKNKAKEMLNK